MDINEKINELIETPQYSLTDKEKNNILLPILLEQIKSQFNNKTLKNFYKKISPFSVLDNISDIPPLPISFFKQYNLSLIPEQEIIRILTSSGTTSQVRSKITLNKETAFRQSRALTNIIKNHIGKQRKPMLIIDTEEVNNPKNESISARGAAIRGLTQFGKDVVYVLDGESELKINYEKLENFIKKYSGEEVIIFGFTYILWTEFYNRLKEKNKKLNLNAILIHSGGWKKLEKQKISKELFNQEISRLFGTKPGNIYDMYGLVEQVGVVFIDCEQGNKHIPNFAEVIIRNPLTMKEVIPGEKGLIEILSVLPNSYPGQAIITEDIGQLIGIDDCKCGRKGKYFRFVSRVDKSEPRGCGDTFNGGKNDSIIL